MNEELTMTVSHAKDCITCVAKEKIDPPIEGDMYHLNEVKVSCALAAALATNDLVATREQYDSIKTDRNEKVSGQMPFCDPIGNAEYSLKHGLEIEG